MISNQVKYLCDYCGTENSDRESHYRAKRYHFCNKYCYANYRSEVLPQEEQNAWQGGITPEESRRRYNKKNQDKLKAMAKSRRLRELNAPGSHTKAEWEAVLHRQGNICNDRGCSVVGDLTKDHKIPLIMGGSNDIDNIQGLCRSHNSKKSRQVYIEELGKLV